MRKVELEIVGIDEKGYAYGFYANKIVYVIYGVPGDVVSVRIRKLRGIKRQPIGTIETILRPSEHRIEPVCKHFGACGGCRFQNIRYDYQLAYKKSMVERTFKKYGIEAEVSDVVPSPTIYNYRNRMDFPVGVREGSLIIGLKELGRWDRVVDLDECHLPSKRCVEVLSLVKRFARERQIEPYNVKTHRGFLRYIVVREGMYTGDMVVCVITRSGALQFNELVDELKGYCSGVVWGINDGLADVSTSEKIVAVHGKELISERVGNLLFFAHPNVFFQTNSYQIPNLVSVVSDFAAGGRLLVDVYSGVGLFSIALASKYDEVLGVELDPNAVNCAKMNREVNAASNVSFIQGYAEETLTSIDKKVDAMVVDPPRSGMSKAVIRNILRLSPGEIIYVSCSAETMARDIKMLYSDYTIEGTVKLIDLFPQTPHVEAVVKLVER